MTNADEAIQKTYYIEGGHQEKESYKRNDFLTFNLSFRAYRG